MQRVHEGLVNRLVQRGRREWQSPRKPHLAGLRAGTGKLTGNRGPEGRGHASLGELGGNVAAKLLQNEGAQHGHS